MKVIRLLGTDEILDMAAKAGHRQELYGESAYQALLVVLLNFGEKYVKVECVEGEWHGTKEQLRSSTGAIPKCPNGHVLLETTLAPRLALIEE